MHKAFSPLASSGREEVCGTHALLATAKAATPTIPGINQAEVK